MRTGGVLNLLGKLILFISLFLLTPIPFSIFYNDGMVHIFLLCASIGALTGGGLLLLFAPEKELRYRDGFAVVVFSWVALALLGALPFYFSGYVPSFIDCLFESMSGFTTTGSTILFEIEILPKSVLFWRALTQWLGGMGIIVLTIAILPLLGVGGAQLFQAEMPGPTKDRLTPRIQDTARILWGVYFLFTVVLIALLMGGGLTFFDAVCHAFTTVATGGFSTYSASIGHFQSAYIETVIIVFMFLGGINFALHYLMLCGRLSAWWQSEEFRLYLGLIVVSTVIIMTANTFYNIYDNFLDSFRSAAFQVVAIITTSGFSTSDFEYWPSVCKVLLVSLMLVGGCAGSTSGSIKVVRFLLFFKYARLQLQNLVHPRTVTTLKLGKVKVPQEVMVAILGFFALYIIFFMVASLIVTASGVELVTATTAVIATLNNIGPGLGMVGPASNFSDMPSLAKIVLTFCMLAGRLELYTVMVLLTPGFWAMARKPVWRWQMKKSGE